jgi:ABC-2 type transport system ATP-binding protein
MTTTAAHPTTAPAIEARGLTKSYGRKTVVDDLTFQVRPGKVTGFLGPNGAGKSTTMRLLLGLEAPDSGEALISGKPYASLSAPLSYVGALLEAKAFHKGRTARNHLLALAQSQALPTRRVDEVLDLVGLHDVAKQRAGGYSLGMSQRLGIAAALLGDPRIVLLDEPVNGLDPEGILWIRNLMKRLAAEGRTVLVSSHLMNEMAVTAEHLLVIGRGRLLADCTTAEFIQRHTDPEVYNATPAVARPALLEEAFMRLTAGAVQYAAR